MNLPGGSSYPGYLPPVPPKPPDIKGEYIEECDDIKEETEERLTPAPSQQPFLNTQCQFPMFRGMHRVHSIQLTNNSLDRYICIFD